MLQLWMLFVLGALSCWGMYGPTIHIGQVALGDSPMRALLCVGGAYFLMGVLVPGLVLATRGEAGQFTAKGITVALIAGALGAGGAICVIFAFRNGGQPSARDETHLIDCARRAQNRGTRSHRAGTSSRAAAIDTRGSPGPPREPALRWPRSRKG